MVSIVDEPVPLCVFGLALVVLLNQFCCIVCVFLLIFLLVLMMLLNQFCCVLFVINSSGALEPFVLCVVSGLVLVDVTEPVVLLNKLCC